MARPSADYFVRPMTLADVGPVERLSDDAFLDLETRTHRTGWPAPARRSAEAAGWWRDRLAHLVRSDPRGCWVAEDDSALLGAAGEPFTADWVRVCVTDAARPPELFARVRRRFPHALVVQHRPEQRAHRAAVAVTAAHDPLEVAADFVEHVTGAAPSAAEAAVLRDALEAVLAADRSA